MPLIIITGLPGSGKSYRAQQILANFEARVTAERSTTHLAANLSVQHLTSSHASLDPPNNLSQTLKPTDPPTNPRDLIYNSAREEKTARAEEFSTVKRALSKNNIVISDAPNYIKGFRYQLWCEAKAVGTRSVVVHVAAREDECESWNTQRLKAWKWEDISGTGHGPSETTNSRAKVGRDVQGDLQPESHTAIYGDRLAEHLTRATPRSRSSSMGGAESDPEETSGRKYFTETMTLKSLYISDRKSNLKAAESEVANGHSLRSRFEESVEEAIEAQTADIPSEPPAPDASLPYAPATLRSLCMRYEPPSPFTRWDTPLFTIPSSDIHPPYQAIWDALFPPPAKPPRNTVSQLKSGTAAESKPDEVRRHAATVLPKATGAEALQNLEAATADVVKILLAAAQEKGITDGEGGNLAFTIPDPKFASEIHVEVEIPLNTMLSQPALQRLRRKYTQIQRGGIAHGQGYTNGRAEVVNDFSNFLVTEWNAE